VGNESFVGILGSLSGGNNGSIGCGKLGLGTGKSSVSIIQHSLHGSLVGNGIGVLSSSSGHVSFSISGLFVSSGDESILSSVSGSGSSIGSSVVSSSKGFSVGLCFGGFVHGGLGVGSFSDSFLIFRRSFVGGSGGLVQDEDSILSRLSGLVKGSGISDGSLFGVNVGNGSSGSSLSEFFSFGLVDSVVSNVCSPGFGGNKSLVPFSFDRVNDGGDDSAGTFV